MQRPTDLKFISNRLRVCHALLYSITTFIGLILCCPGIRAQGKGFTPCPEDSALLVGLSQQYEQQYQEECDGLPSHYRKDYLKVYDDRWKSIKEVFDQREIYTSLVAQRYLDALVGEIVRDNPTLQGLHFRCYFSRTYIPNASYIGEGIILFNMGLFDRLTDESQAVFILCHEISHYLLRHQEKSIDKYVTAINSPEVQAQLRKIKGSEYHKRDQVETLVKGIVFDSRQHSRDHESEADSMAVVLMRGTPFAMSGAVSTLGLLDSVDRDDFDTEGSLQHTFNSSDYPFRKKWLAREEGLLGGHARLQQDEMADSLKTHPDCPLRVRLISPLVVGTAEGSGAQRGAAEGGRGRVFVIDSVKFRMLQESFRYEVIEYAFATKEYTQSLFLALKLLQRRPDDVYAVSQVGRVLNGLYQAQKGHTLGRVADLPGPDYPVNYNALLQFVQNLYLEDLAAISYYYLTSYRSRLYSYEPFKNVFDESVAHQAEQ